MKIALPVTHFLPSYFGGLETYVYRLAQELRRQGHEAVVFTSAPHLPESGDGGVKQYEYYGVPVRAVSLAGEGFARTEASESPLSHRHAFEAALGGETFDLFHIHGHEGVFVPLAKERGRPFVMTIHTPERVCPSGNFLRPDGALCNVQPEIKTCIACTAAKRCGAGSLKAHGLSHLPTRLVKIANRFIERRKAPSYLERGLQLPYRVIRRLQHNRRLLHNTDLLIAPSNATARALRHVGVPRERIRVVRHGIVPFPRKPLTPLNNRLVRFAYLGRMNPDKGLLVLADALAALPPDAACEIHLMGKPQNSYEETIRAQLIDRIPGQVKVVDHGFVPPDEIANGLALVDVVLVPSVCLEVFGLVVQEAFSVGRPVIAAAETGPSEQLRDGVDGRVVRRGDATALRGAMLEVIRNPQQIQKWACHIRRVPTIADHIHDLFEVYAEALHAKRDSANEHVAKKRLRSLG